VSVRVRTTLAAVVVTTVAVGVAGWYLERSLEDTQLGQVRDEMHDQLDQVVARLEAGASPQDALAGPPQARFVQICDADGHVVAAPPGMRTNTEMSAGDLPSRCDPAGPGEAPGSGEPGEPGRGDGPTALGAMVTSDGGSVVAGRVETVTRSVATDDGRLEVVASAPVGQLEQVARSVDALRGALTVGLPLLVVVVAAVAWIVVGRALRPVEAIRTEVDEITGSTMHRRVPEPPTADEIGRLARTMNAMLHRLDETATRQRRFVSDASHELRSPVAAIRTGLEVARRKGDAANWTAVADTALAEEARLEALLDDLLLLATQDEHGAGAPGSTTVDLAATAVTEAGRPRPLLVEVDVGVAGGDDPLLVPGIEDQLTRVVGNLLDNATRHAASTVRVDVARHNGTVQLTVDDDGPGIPPDDRERVFERFTRLDDGRSRTTGGTGLGLAVVRTIVTRHHGEVWADASPLGGARLTLTLPAAPPPAPPVSVRPTARRPGGSSS
jgi:signal transduction histidine kinase